MGKNLVVRLHVYLMCFLLAFSPAYAHASAAPKLDLAGITNFARDAGGAVADYLFKRASNDPNYNAANDDRFETKAHRVSNSALGEVGFKRILGLTPWGLVGAIATGFAVGELVNALQEKGWVVDRGKQEIYKPAGYRYCLRANYKYVTSSSQFCADRPVAAVSLYISHYNPLEKQSKVYTNSSGTQVQGKHTALASPVQISITDQNAEVRAKVTEVDGSYSTPPVDQQFFLDAKPVGKQVATSQDVADVLPNVSDEQIKSLMGSPDFQFEQHAPAVAAAAKAEPKAGTSTDTDAPPKDKENQCPSGQAVDPATGKCKAWESKCPAGQVFDPVKKKCVPVKADDDDDDGDEWPEFCEWASPVCYYIEWAMDQKPKVEKEWPKFCDWAEPVCDFIEEYKTKKDDPDDWPEFCDWAKPVCDFIDWVKKSPDDTEPLPVDVEDTAGDAQSITSQILTLGYVSGGVRACPSDLDLSFQFMGQSIGFELSYEPLCDMLLTARPVVIAIAYFQAAKIVFVGRRD